MAGGDYASCANCKGKAFYDADCNTDYEDAVEEGRVVALCRTCGPRFEITVVPVAPKTPPATTDAAPDGRPWINRTVLVTPEYQVLDTRNGQHRVVSELLPDDVVQATRVVSVVEGDVLGDYYRDDDAVSMHSSSDGTTTTHVKKAPEYGPWEGNFTRNAEEVCIAAVEKEWPGYGPHPGHRIVDLDGGMSECSCGEWVPTHGPYVPPTFDNKENNHG